MLTWHMTIMKIIDVMVQPYIALGQLNYSFWQIWNCL